MTTNTVFSRAVRQRNKHMTYSQMEATTWKVGGKEGSRSSAWWNNMANYHMDTPPAPKFLPGIAAVLKLPERTVQELIAEQWYGIRPDDQVPEHLRPLLAALKGVERDDLPALQPLVQSLSEKYTLKIMLGSLEPPKDEPDEATDD